MAGYQLVNSQRVAKFDGFDLVDKEGNIRKPADYRDRYESLGTYTVIDPKGNQMHVMEHIWDVVLYVRTLPGASQKQNSQK